MAKYLIDIDGIRKYQTFTFVLKDFSVLMALDNINNVVKERMQYETCELAEKNI